MLVDSKRGPRRAQAVAENDPVELPGQRRPPPCESAPAQPTEDSTDAEAAAAARMSMPQPVRR